MNAKSPSSKLGTKRHKYATKLKSTSPKCETTVEGGAPAGRNGVDSTTYSNERSLTRLVSINLAREASMGQLNPDSPARLDQGGPIGLTNGIGRSGGDGERDPATEAAITLTDCFLRRESSLEKLGLLKRESSLGGAAVKRTNSMEWKPNMQPLPQRRNEELPAPPATKRQSSLHSLASIAEMTSTKNGQRNIFGDVSGGVGETLERNLSLVFQQQDSARDLLNGQASGSETDESDDESDDEHGALAKKEPYKPQNSYEFFAQNTPQQLYQQQNSAREEGTHDLFAPSFNDLAAVALAPDNRRAQPGQQGRVLVSSPRNQVVNWNQAAVGAASPMNLHQHQMTHPSQPRYIGKLTVEERRKRVQRYLDKKKRRVWGRKVEYQCRKTLASKRQRVHGRFA